jgi:transglutaminase-like putative cysteine protease
MHDYLRSTDIIDWKAPNVLELARRMAGGSAEATAKRCFEWVRDEIRHSGDYQLNPVTCAASEVLTAGTGYCYAKSHLLAALLRANSIAAGLCYQRLSIEGSGPPFCLHGLSAVYLPESGWYRIDPRGNKTNVDAQFTPPVEQLAFRPSVVGEVDLPGVYSDPLPQIVQALREYKTFDAVAEHLPDMPTSSAAY